MANATLVRAGFEPMTIHMRVPSSTTVLWARTYPDLALKYDPDHPKILMNFFYGHSLLCSQNLIKISLNNTANKQAEKQTHSGTVKQVVKRLRC